MILRETDQNPNVIAEFVEMIAIGQTLPPIVTVDDTVLDGHHRARAYQQLGQVAPVLNISHAQYQALVDAGYDDMEIAGAVHFALSDGYGAEMLNSQFGGANLYNRAADAAELL